MAYTELLKASSKSAKRKRKAKAAKKQAKRESSSWKPPPGYSPIPKSKKGGYRKMVGGQWDYKYPKPAGASSAPTKDPSAELAKAVEIVQKAPGIAKKAQRAVQELAQHVNKIARASASEVFVATAALGQFYKKKHHEIEEMVHMAKVASDLNVDVAQVIDLSQSLAQMVMALEHFEGRNDE